MALIDELVDVGSNPERVTGTYAVCRGRTYRAGGADSFDATLYPDEDDRALFERVLENPLRCRVSLRELDGLVDVKLYGRFDGRQVLIYDVQPTRITFFYPMERPDELTARHHLEPVHAGFRGWVRRERVEILGEHVDDLLYRRTRRRSVNA